MEELLLATVVQEVQLSLKQLILLEWFYFLLAFDATLKEGETLVMKKEFE
jgi:hypothetical protein